MWLNQAFGCFVPEWLHFGPICLQDVVQTAKIFNDSIGAADNQVFL